jgi:DNA-binding transcriptional regulator YdaS (Cro superfamily)
MHETPAKNEVKMKGFNLAVEKAGGSVRLAREIKADRQLVDYWVKTGRPSPQFCVAISDLTGVPLHDLRPDVFPPEAAG